MNENLRITALNGFLLGGILYEMRKQGWGPWSSGTMVVMDLLTILLIVAVVLLLVFLVAGKSGAGLNVNWGLIQTILIIVVLILAAIWLYQQVA